MNDIVTGDPFIHGKTKVGLAVEGHSDLAVFRAFDDITRDDDPSATKTLKGKAVYSTLTSAAVFELLARNGLPVAFVCRLSDTDTLMKRTEMIPLEIIVRRYAVGSYLQRCSDYAVPGKVPHRFDQLLFELFLKTSNGKFTDSSGDEHTVQLFVEGTNRRVDDPWIVNPYESEWTMLHPKHPADALGNACFDRTFDQSLILPPDVTVDTLEHITKRAFEVIEHAFNLLKHHLLDFKIEFGITADGQLVISDVIDNDSWRLRTQD